MAGTWIQISVSCPELHDIGTQLIDIQTAIAVTVATLGAFSVFNIGMRIYKLVRPKDPWRPANTKPWFLDFFMINYLVIFVLVTIVISSATTDPPKIRQASMPQAVVLYFVSIEILLCDLFAYLGLKTPFRFSSTEKGADIPPASLIIIEDVVAVDGAGGVEFREALQLRYSASPQFRRLLWQMDLFWATGGLLIAIAVTLIIFLCSNEIVGFAVGESFKFLLHRRFVTDWCDRMGGSFRLGCSVGSYDNSMGTERTCQGTRGLCCCEQIDDCIDDLASQIMILIVSVQEFTLEYAMLRSTNLDITEGREISFSCDLTKCSKEGGGKDKWKESWDESLLAKSARDLAHSNSNLTSCQAPKLCTVQAHNSRAQTLTMEPVSDDDQPALQPTPPPADSAPINSPLARIPVDIGSHRALLFALDQPVQFDQSAWEQYWPYVLS